MNNLFSIFDPASCFGLSLNWSSTLILMIFVLPWSFWLTSNQNLKIFKIVSCYLHEEIVMALGSVKPPGMSHCVLSLFWLIVMNNLFGLIPYIFTSTSHLVTTLSMGLTLWISVMAGALVRDLSMTLSHLVPSGTPYTLMPLMVMIELVSNVIRPATLSIRLAANMVAGHLLLTLAGGPASILSVSLTMTSLIVITLMMVLELAVAVIQSYVFSTLSSLYLGDVNSINTSY